MKTHNGLEQEPLVIQIGIMAYNEKKNIGRLLDRLGRISTPELLIREITVVSASTDGTDEIVGARAAADERIKLVREPMRQGKCAAVNLFLERVAAPVAMLIGADTMPGPGAVRALAAPFRDPAVGMTGARPVPVNRGARFMDFAARFLWQAHHLLALAKPKCGEMVAFRPVFEAMTPETIVDEPEIMALVAERGLKIIYEPEAVVYNWGPDTTAEFISRRRSITAGYLQQSARGRRLHSIPFGVKLRMGAGLFGWLLAQRRPVDFAYAACAVILELWSRVLGRWDFMRSRTRPGLHIWKIAASTKRGDWESAGFRPDCDRD